MLRADSEEKIVAQIRMLHLFFSSRLLHMPIPQTFNAAAVNLAQEAIRAAETAKTRRGRVAKLADEFLGLLG